MKKTLFNQDWLFVKDHVDLSQLKQHAFKHLTLPHTWNNQDGQDGGNDYLRTVSTYLKYFDYQKSSNRVFIEFEGVNSVSNVYLNGTHLGEHRGGYSRFRFDITDLIQATNNQLVVYVDNRHHEDVYPLAADFTFYGGIYRNVYLVETDALSFDLTYWGGNGVYVSQTNVNHNQATLSIDSYIRNSGFA
jgi:beta-galactosidase